ncbi:MAG: hypothetical protein JO262_10265 [Solirubrobacterales bacterium]|nr:hypothetical protein [Solirubrobacterales bacterium]MBV9942501.1 hypothetical protein [Solirubrobacterales bacterium]
MATSIDHRPHAVRGFDESIERAIGADMRLLYGMLGAILVLCGVIVLLALSPTTWPLPEKSRRFGAQPARE